VPAESGVQPEVEGALPVAREIHGAVHNARR
jgi:hypothetical protein